MIAAFIGANCLLQYQFGSTNSTIIDDRFTCGKDPDALAEFYEAHDLLEVMMPLPFLFKFVMDQVVWDGEPPSDTKPPLLTMDESRCYVLFVYFCLFMKCLPLELLSFTASSFALGAPH